MGTRRILSHRLRKRTKNRHTLFFFFSFWTFLCHSHLNKKKISAKKLAPLQLCIYFLKNINIQKVILKNIFGKLLSGRHVQQVRGLLGRGRQRCAQGRRREWERPRSCVERGGSVLRLGGQRGGQEPVHRVAPSRRGGTESWDRLQ